MLQFQPPGFGQRVLATTQGAIAYYTPVGAPWRSPSEPEVELPTLLFLHSLGGGSSAFEWSKVYPAFAPDYRVIAPDLIGWGQSTHPPKDYRVEDYLTQLTELLEHLAPNPATVFASSLMGAIAIRLAIQRPDLVQQLILVCPSGYNDFNASYAGGIAAQLARVPGLDRLIYAAGAANEVAVRNFLETFLFAERSRVTEEIVAAYLTSAEQPNAEYAALSSLRGDLCFDLALYIGQLQVPTVFLWGEQARFTSSELGRRLKALCPPAIAAFYEIPNAGVLPHLECPEIVIGLVRRHLPVSRP